MIPAKFDYVAPASLDEALSALQSGGEDAKVLAGGHSLLPLMKLRLAAPELLVDLRRVPGLTGIEREIAAADLVQDYLTTAVADDEVITSVNYPALDGYGFGYQKFNRRKEDWAMVAVSALVKKASDGSCEDVRIGLTHMSSVPLRATAAENALRGGALTADAIAAAAEQAAEGTDPPGDLNASPDYKRHLARVLCRRALEEAVA